MPEIVNTSFISTDIEAEEDNRPVMIRAADVSMVFNMASESLNNLKEYAIALARRELRFKELRALDSISFEVKKGDVFGIVGTNGSGKSTMLKIVAGVLEPTDGQIELNGNIAPLIELGAGFDMELTARENIYLNGALLGYSKKFIEQHFDQIVDFAEIEKFLDMPMKNYSSGMVARIAFAIATVIVPEILIVDEVLAVGDFMFQRKCEDRITELIEQHGVTVLIVSHSNEQIARLCNKAIWIEKGHTRLLGDANMVTRVYGGLAGRTGSAESEQRVFEALMKGANIDENAYDVIRGESPLRVSADIAKEALDDACVDDIVLFCSSTHANAVSGCALAASLGAATFATKPDEISDSTLRILFERQPKRIHLIDCEEVAAETAASLADLPWRPEVEVIGGTQAADNAADNTLACSLRVFERMREAGHSPTRIAITGFDSNSESLAFTPFLYREGCPAFVTKSNDQKAATAIRRTIEGSGIETIYLVGAALDPVFAEVMSEAGYETIAVGTVDDADPCLEVGRFVSERNPHPLAPRRILMATQGLVQWTELITCGFACAKTGSDLLLVNETSLDSISDHMRLITELSGGAPRLTFIGDNEGLGHAERSVFSTIGME